MVTNISDATGHHRHVVSELRDGSLPMHRVQAGARLTSFTSVFNVGLVGPADGDRNNNRSRSAVHLGVMRHSTRDQEKFAGVPAKSCADSG